jgi:hypothetical protein
VEEKGVSSIIVIAIVVAISISIIAIVWLRVENREQNVGYFHLLPDNYVEISGKVKGFTPLSGPPFFRFSAEVNSVQYEVIGCDQVVFLDNVISPVFSGIQVKWETQPFVKVFGKMIDNDTIAANIVDENINGVLQNWYYKSFLDKYEQFDYFVLGNYNKKLVWVNGLLTKEDLLFLLYSPDNHFTSQISPYLGKEAYANGTIQAAYGIGLVVENLFVKQDNSYIRIFP